MPRMQEVVSTIKGQCGLTMAAAQADSATPLDA